MMNVIVGIAKESLWLAQQMSPYILFGLLVAGLLHVVVPTERVVHHLGASNLLSVIKAALIGIPLPLCSCSVLPTALSLRKQGSSRGSVLSFLITTPTSGVDSLLVTYSLLGALFALYRAFASFVSGLVAGVTTNILVAEDQKVETVSSSCSLCERCDEHSHSAAEKTQGIFSYAFGELLQDMGVWLLVGIVAGGLISYLIPDEFIRHYLGIGWFSMFAMFAVGIPLYVCATASVPIAAALMLKGMSPGAALVFLLAGPATNTVTITLVGRYLGRRSVVIYIASVAVTGILLGWLLNHIWEFISVGEGFMLAAGAGEKIPPAVSSVCTVILMAGIVVNLVRKFRGKMLHT
jgi:uncharacterized membrane protein YraQ (UPF0718 family)